MNYLLFLSEIIDLETIYEYVSKRLDFPVSILKTIIVQ